MWPTQPRDRQLFCHLPTSGLDLYVQPTDDPQVSCALIFPFGAAHNVKDIPAGCSQLIKMLSLLSSEAYPSPWSYYDQVKEAQGKFLIDVEDWQTIFYLISPYDRANEMVEGLFHQALDPGCSQDVLEEALERLPDPTDYPLPFYPGSNPLEHHVATGWLDDCPISAHQRLGNRASWTQTTPSLIRTLRERPPGKLCAFLAGCLSDASRLIYNLLTLGDRPVADPLPAHVRPAGWRRRSQHVLRYQESQVFQFFGGLCPSRLDFATRQGLRFFAKYLLSPNGPLYSWLKEEAGLSNSEIANTRDLVQFSSHRNRTIWILQLPLRSGRQAAALRRQFPTLVETALDDRAGLVKEVERQRHARLTQTYFEPFARVSTAAEEWAYTGGLETEEELSAQLDRFTDPAYLKGVVRRHFLEGYGQFTALPE